MFLLQKTSDEVVEFDLDTLISPQGQEKKGEKQHAVGFVR
jgi:hypothetical protein